MVCINPWRRKISWHPGIQPAKLCATSKITLLQSVTWLSSARMSSGIAPEAIEPWSLSSSATADRAQTLQ
jgi:hypothetical protein